MLTTKRTNNYDSISWQCENEDGSRVDLTGATAQFIMGKKNKLITNAPAQITSAADGIVEYKLTNSDTLVAGTFLGEFEITFPTGEKKTFPSNGYITVAIGDNLDNGQVNVVLDMIAAKQGDFEAKLSAILAQAGNINMSSIDEYTWSTIANQVSYTFPVTSTYTRSAKWFKVYVGGIPVDDSLLNRAFDNKFELLIDPTLIKEGTKVTAQWMQPMAAIAPTSYKVIPQQSSPPVDAVEGDMWFDTSDDTYQGTVLEGIDTRMTNAETSLAERAKSVKDFDSLKIAVTDGYDYAPCINAALNSTYQYIFVPDGSYLVGSSILIPDNKRLVLSYNATLVRYFIGTGSANATIRNVNQSSSSRNTNIGLFGGYVKSFNSAKTGKHIAFWGVDDVKIDNIKMRDVFGDWSIHFRDCTNVIGKGIDIDTKGTDLFSDGLHITGGSKYVFSDLIIKSSDDCISLTVETAQDTNIDGVTITNAHLTTTSSSIIKMTTKTGTTPTIKNVKIKNIVGIGGTTGQGESIVIKDEDNAGRISDIEVEASVDCTNGAGVGFRLQGVNRIKGKIDVKAPQGKGADISYSNDWKLAIRVDSPRTAGVSGITLQNVDDFELTPEVINSTLHGVEVGGTTAPATNGRILNGKTKNSTNTGIRLINAVGVTVTNNKCFGDANGIIEDSGSSDYNTIAFNDVRTVTTTKIASNGANSKIPNNNLGYKTYNRGTNSIGSSLTSVTVSHGLDSSPSAAGIKVTPTSLLGSAKGLYVDTSLNTATTFTVKCDVAPGSVVNFMWEAVTGKY